MKRLTKVLLVTMFLSVVTCAVVSAAEPLVLWAPPGESPVLQRLITQWSKETGIEVTIVDVPYIAQHEKLALDGPAGRGPDVFTTPHDQLGKLVLPGLVSPITVNEQALKAFPSGILEAVSYGGELYGLPRSAEGVALVYNKDLLPEIPETMDELISWARTLPEGVYGFLYEVNNVFMSWGFFSGYDAYVFGQTEQGYDVLDLGLDRPEAVRALEFLVDLATSGLIPPGTDYGVANSLFLEGKVGATINGSWALGDYRQAGLNYGIGLIPPLQDGGTHRTWVTVGGWWVSAFSQKQEQAIQLIEFLASEQVVVELFEEVGTVPAHLGALEHPVVKSDPDLQGFARQSSLGSPTPNVPEMVAVWGPFMDAVKLAINGDATPQVALTLAVSDLRETIEDMRARSQ